MDGARRTRRHGSHKTIAPMRRRRRRRQQLAAALITTAGAGPCPVPQLDAKSHSDLCDPPELLQIWNDGSKPIQAYRLSSDGAEVQEAAPIGRGAAIVTKGCEGTVWRARLQEGRLVAEFTQGKVEEAATAAVSISASALSEDVASERWRVQDCSGPAPQFPVRARFSEVVDTGSSFDLHITRGGARSRDEVSRAEAVPGPEIFADVTLDLLEAWRGGKLVKFAVKRSIVCHVCGGLGAPSLKIVPCDRCGGSGLYQATWRPANHSLGESRKTVCGKCKGWGETWLPDHACPACGGARLQEEERWFSIALPEGVRDGWKLVRDGLGETKLEPERGALRAQLEPGPLVLRVHVDAHENFTRSGDDLIAPVELDASEMVFGFSRLVEHLDGSLVVFNRTEPSPPGTELRIAGRGFRHFEVEDSGPSDVRGDFVVRVELGVPETDSGEKQEFYEGMVGKI